MAHYALIDENNIVVQVITGVDENETQTDLDGTLVGGSTGAWEQFYASQPWFAGLTCKRTSYWTRAGVHINQGTPFRGNYAGIGDYYDAERDVFYQPKPFESWILDEETFVWQPPVSRPPREETEEPIYYKWDEPTLSWVVLDV